MEYDIDLELLFCLYMFINMCYYKVYALNKCYTFSFHIKYSEIKN